jgi:hypothetical protein
MMLSFALSDRAGKVYLPYVLHHEGDFKHRLSDLHPETISHVVHIRDSTVHRSSASTCHIQYVPSSQ